MVSGSSPLARGGLLPRTPLTRPHGLIPAGAGRTKAEYSSVVSWRAHPRWRGADAPPWTDAQAERGSSPLARGGPPTILRPRESTGLIPAGAGRTTRCACGVARDGAHPRWRGADDADLAEKAGDLGSSPLARGGRGDLVLRDRPTGLIPAGAGRTVDSIGRLRWRRAHPRWRGADGMETYCLTFGQGSSPLARGGRVGCPSDPQYRGLIPAGAGRTTSPSTRTRSVRAHPRWRGADAGDFRTKSRPEGSSPLARGGPTWPAGQVPGGRLIPAGAGRTVCRRLNLLGKRAHPRWRGADGPETGGAGSLAGSSPLARGGPAPVAFRASALGLIPAGAGRTPGGCRLRGGLAAHPRWRGADRSLSKVLHWVDGSSPLARGGHVIQPDGTTARGLIPAGAGRTCACPRMATRSTAHPRWRGADSVRDGRLDVGLGSSPLARGGLRPARHRHRPLGLIPAGAGRTGPPTTPSGPKGAHPPWRGADRRPSDGLRRPSGSSPLARGGPRRR